jgi:hypothetical protein
VQAAIVGYHRDEVGDWVAELDYGHRRHVRHRPPFELRPWVVEVEGRRRRLGTTLECGICDQNVPAPTPSLELGGEAACLAHVVCPDCGVVLGSAAITATAARSRRSAPRRRRQDVFPPFHPGMRSTRNRPRG